MPEFLSYNFDACSGVRALTTLSLDDFGWGNSDGAGDVLSQILRKRACLARALGCEILWLDQVHGSDVLVAETFRADEKPPHADGMVTFTRKVACAVLTADCLPVLMAVPGGPVAAVHAGWRGLAAGVLESALLAMKSDPARIHVHIGPHIGQTSYQVGRELCGKLVKEEEDREAFAPDAIEGKLCCDLALLARLRLKRAGVMSISTCTLDTYQYPQLLHSARRDKERSGRMASVIWLA